MKCVIFYCIECSKGSLSEEEISKCGCDPQFRAKGVFTVPLKRNRWGRFLYWFWSLDITYWTAFMAAIAINAILISHIDLSFKQQLLESVCMGLLLPRLLNNEPK